MKNIIIILSTVLFAFSIISCEKCSTCTFEDPQRGTLKSDDVCQKGNAYDQTMKQYEERGWSCQKK